ncbi:MAG: trehalose 6-phosphate synthase, partial [Candidatus Omnitrophica bacterium]|nr:trehalose 6-phosphate synthase [Candidatus Omnitrophota bacterium]
GLDIEIILTVQSGEKDGLKDFDKGDALRFINADAGLGLEKSKNFICGDTASDLPMLEAATQFSEDTWSVFVNARDSLKDKAKKICPNILFIEKPDILVSILNELSKPS